MTGTVYTLTSDCGHHCIVYTSTDTRVVEHCSCSECHDGPAPAGEVRRITP